MFERDEGYDLEEDVFELHEISEIEGTGIVVIYVNFGIRPIGETNRYLTVLFCTDEDHSDGVFVCSASDREEELSHQGILDIAVNDELLDDETTDGDWVLVYDVVEGVMVRKSGGFGGEVNEHLWGQFLDWLYENDVLDFDGEE